MTAVSREADVQRRSAMRRASVMAILGAVVGTLIGILVTVGIVMWGLTEVVDGARDSLSIAPIVEFTRSANGDVAAESGLGVLVPAGVGLILGGLGGFLLSRSRPHD